MACNTFQIVLKDPDGPLDGMVFPVWCQDHNQPHTTCLDQIATAGFAIKAED